MTIRDSIVDDEEYAQRLAIKTNGGVTFLKVEDLSWIDAAGNYVRLNTREGDRHLLRETMSALEKRLDPKRFVRIHRSTIVNVKRIREIRPQTHGEQLVVMEEGQRLTLSRSYRDRLQEFTS